MNKESIWHTIQTIRAVIAGLDELDMMPIKPNMGDQTRLLELSVCKQELVKELVRAVEVYISDEPCLLEKFQQQIFEVNMQSMLAEHQIHSATN